MVSFSINLRVVCVLVLCLIPCQTRGEVPELAGPSGKHLLIDRFWSGPLLISPDGKTLFGGEDNAVCMWAVAKRVRFRLLPAQEDGCMALSSDGSLLATFEMTRNATHINIWRVPKRQDDDVPMPRLVEWPRDSVTPRLLKPHRRLTVKYGLLFSYLIFSPDGNRLAAFSNGLVVFEIETGSVLFERKNLDDSDPELARSRVAGVAFSEDGKQILVSGLTGLRVYDSNTFVEQAAYAEPRHAELRAISDGRLWVRTTGSWSIWDANKFVKVADLPFTGNHLARHPGGKLVFGQTEGVKGLVLWHVELQRPVLRITKAQMPAVWTPDGSRIIARGLDGDPPVGEWDLKRWLQESEVKWDRE